MQSGRNWNPSRRAAGNKKPLSWINLKESVGTNCERMCQTAAAEEEMVTPVSARIHPHTHTHARQGPSDVRPGRRWCNAGPQREDALGAELRVAPSSTNSLGLITVHLSLIKTRTDTIVHSLRLCSPLECWWLRAAAKGPSLCELINCNERLSLRRQLWVWLDGRWLHFATQITQSS